MRAPIARDHKLRKEWVDSSPLFRNPAPVVLRIIQRTQEAKNVYHLSKRRINFKKISNAWSNNYHNTILCQMKLKFIPKMNRRALIEIGAIFHCR